MTDLLGYVNAGAALLLAVVAALRMRRGGHARRWAAAAFSALAIVLLVGALYPDGGGEWTRKGLVCVLLSFPYLLLRFTASLRAVATPVARAGTAATAGLLIATLALPSLPARGAAQPGWFAVYVAAIVVFWTALSLATIAGLWRGGAGQPTLARRRTRLMSSATAGMNVLILLAGVGVTGGTGQLAVQGLLLLSVVAFAVGVAPPAWVRLAWRQPEQDALARASQELVRATTVSQVTDTLLPHVARIVGGSGAALCAQDGRVVSSVGRAPSSELDAGASAATETTHMMPLSPPFGALVVATSPLTPFFGRDELRLLDALGALADLALSRCSLTEREQRSQAALQRAMEDVERANTAKTDFLSRMSHELRTPLNVVLGFGQLLEMRGSLDAKDEQAVEHILRAGRHLLELINEVLDLSRIESGRMTISPEAVAIAELAGEAVDLIRPLAQSRNVRITTDLETCDAHVTADRQRLKQVLLNLLSNAVKYNRDGGSVSVSCEHGTRGRLRLRVDDTGAGIPSTMMGRLFEPFERLGAEQGHVEGTGLGLALSRQLVELMGGEVGAQSREGAGSTFWLDLAVAEAPHHDTATTRVEPGYERPVRPPRLRRVLLIEDNLANVKLIQALISDRDHIELLPAMTGRLGLELAREHCPHLILLDQHLPDITGTEVFQRLKADPGTRDITVVIVSADATPGQIRKMRELGADDYLTKPLDVHRFLQVIDGIVDDDRSGTATLDRPHERPGGALPATQARSRR